MSSYRVFVEQVSDSLKKEKIKNIEIKKYENRRWRLCEYKIILSDVLGKRLNGPDVTNDDSFAMRLIEWSEFGKLYLNDAVGVFFGYDFYYSKHIDDSAINNFYIDDLYLDVLLHIGLIGLLLLFYLLWNVWIYIFRFYSFSLFGKVIMSVFSTLPIINLTTDSIFMYFQFLVILLLIKEEGLYESLC